MRLIDADALKDYVIAEAASYGLTPSQAAILSEFVDMIDEQQTVSPWHRAQVGSPKEAGEYIVAYHPCYWDDVDTEVTRVGIDNFRGKSAWAKKKFQRVTHWMEKPEPPKEGNDA